MHLAYIPLSLETKYQKGKKEHFSVTLTFDTDAKKERNDRVWSQKHEVSLYFLWFNIFLPHIRQIPLLRLIYGPTVLQQCLWWHSEKFLTTVSFAAFLIYLIPSPQRHAFSDGINYCFHFLWIEVKIYLLTNCIRIGRESNSLGLYEICCKSWVPAFTQSKQIKNISDPEKTLTVSA